MSGERTQRIVTSFLEQARSAGLRPPVRIAGEERACWHAGGRGGEVVLLDAEGELWWGAFTARSEASLSRRCSREEADALLRSMLPALGAVFATAPARRSA